MRTLKQITTTLLIISMLLSLTGCQFIDDIVQVGKDFNDEVIQPALTDAPDNSTPTAVTQAPTSTPTTALVQTVNLVPMYYNGNIILVDSATLDSDTVTVYVITSIVNGQALYSTTTIPRSALTDTVSTETVVITSAPVIVEVEKEVIKEIVITSAPVVITSAPEIVVVTRIVTATPTATNTVTPTNTNTATPTATNTVTPTNTKKPTNTPTNTVKITNTNTPTVKPAYNDPSWQQQVKVTNTPSPTPIKTSDKTDYVKDVDYYMYTYSTYYSKVSNIETCDIYKDTDYSTTLTYIKGNNIKIHVVGEYYDKNGSLKLYKVEYNNKTGYMNVADLISAKVTPTPTPTSVMDSIDTSEQSFDTNEIIYQEKGSDRMLTIYSDYTARFSGNLSLYDNSYDDVKWQDTKAIRENVEYVYIDRDVKRAIADAYSFPNVKEAWIDGTNFINDDITIGLKETLLGDLAPNLILHFYTLQGEPITIRVLDKGTKNTKVSLGKQVNIASYNGIELPVNDMMKKLGEDKYLAEFYAGNLTWRPIIYGVNKAELIEVSTDCGFEVIE